MQSCRQGFVQAQADIGRLVGPVAVGRAPVQTRRQVEAMIRGVAAPVDGLVQHAVVEVVTAHLGGLTRGSELAGLKTAPNSYSPA